MLIVVSREVKLYWLCLRENTVLRDVGTPALYLGEDDRISSRSLAILNEGFRHFF